MEAGRGDGGRVVSVGRHGRAGTARLWRLQPKDGGVSEVGDSTRAEKRPLEGSGAAPPLGLRPQAPQDALHVFTKRPESQMARFLRPYAFPMRLDILNIPSFWGCPFRGRT